jgi:hypothetical protein
MWLRNFLHLRKNWLPWNARNSSVKKQKRLLCWMCRQTISGKLTVARKLRQTQVSQAVSVLRKISVDSERQIRDVRGVDEVEAVHGTVVVGRL